MKSGDQYTLGKILFTVTRFAANLQMMGIANKLDDYIESEWGEIFISFWMFFAMLAIISVSMTALSIFQLVFYCIKKSQFYESKVRS